MQTLKLVHIAICNSIFCALTIFDKINRQFLNAEFNFLAARSSGPGGQNVNKVNTKIILQFSVNGSANLTDEEKETIFNKLKNRIDSEGVLQVQCQEKRTQTQNKDLAIKKFYDLLREAFIKMPLRIATKPSKAATQKRLSDKRRQAERKNARSGNFDQ
jgi:ribosome-associated protein